MFATPYPVPAGSGLWQNLGFLTSMLSQREILMPTQKPCSEELTPEQQDIHQERTRRRLWVEHVHSGNRRCRIAKTRPTCGKRAPAMGNGDLLGTAQYTGVHDRLAANNLLEINPAMLLKPGIQIPLGYVP